MTSEPDESRETRETGKSGESARPTPPRQNPNDPTAGDRQLSDEQKQSATDEPAPPKPGRGENLPDPKEVGEAG